MRCDEIMIRNLVFVGPDDPLEKAAQLMRERGIGFVPVCEAQGRAVGAITDRDLVVRALAEGGGERRVGDVMTREVVCCGPGADLSEVEAVMARRQRSRLMVCDDDGRVMGIVSLADLAQHESPAQAGAALRRVTSREHDRATATRASKVAEVMKPDVVGVAPEATIGEAARLMRDRGVGFLPVCDAEGKAHGVLTDRDLAVRGVADRLEASTAVRAVMNREVITCGPEDDLRWAEDLMARHRKSRPLVVDANDRAVGVISLSDVAKHEDPEAVGRMLQQVSAREAFLT